MPCVAKVKWSNSRFVNSFRALCSLVSFRSLCSFGSLLSLRSFLLLPYLTNQPFIYLTDLFLRKKITPNNPELSGQTSILSVLPLSRREQISYPVSCNVQVNGECVTAIVAARNNVMQPTYAITSQHQRRGITALVGGHWSDRVGTRRPSSPGAVPSPQHDCHLHFATDDAGRLAEPTPLR